MVVVRGHTDRGSSREVHRTIDQVFKVIVVMVQVVATQPVHNRVSQVEVGDTLEEMIKVVGTRNSW